MKNLKFSICEDSGSKIAKIEWKGRILYTNIIEYNGNECFSVPNYFSKGDNKVSNSGFKDRIKDMIDTIKNGDGDTIYIRETPFESKYYILYYLNREVGEKYRSNILKRFNGAEFKYAIYNPRDPEGLVYTEDGCFEVMELVAGPQADKHNKKIKVFNSEEEAEKAIFEINKNPQSIHLSNDDDTDDCSAYSYLKAIQIVRLRKYR